MTKYAYMLSVYGEHGAENAHITLDKHAVLEMFLAMWEKELGDEGGTRAESQPYADQVTAALSKNLALPDEEIAALDGVNLGTGWGGYQLHVVKLWQQNP